jgi:hypothetical protein
MTGWPTAPIDPASLGHNGGPPLEVNVEANQETPEAFIARRDGEISNWLAAKAQLESIKLTENDFRVIVTKTLFPTPKRGTQRYDLNGGYKIKLVQNYTYKLGEATMQDEGGNEIKRAEAVRRLEEQIANLGPLHKFHVEKLIKWEPGLDDKYYREMDLNDPIQAEVKVLIDKLLIINPGTPQLTFEEPKPPKE